MLSFPSATSRTDAVGVAQRHPGQCSPLPGELQQDLLPWEMEDSALGPQTTYRPGHALVANLESVCGETVCCPGVVTEGWEQPWARRAVLSC